jgi:hypothetical protein
VVAGALTTVRKEIFYVLYMEKHNKMRQNNEDMSVVGYFP